MLRSVCSHREEALEAAEWLLIETFSTAVVRTKVRKALRSWWKDRKLACFGAPSRDRRLPLIFRAVRGKLRDEIDSNPAIASRDLGWKIGRPLAPCMFHHTKRVLLKYRQQFCHSPYISLDQRFQTVHCSDVLSLERAFANFYATFRQFN